MRLSLRWRGLGYGPNYYQSGTDRTAADGSLVINLPAEALQISGADGVQALQLEVTATDESGQPVSKRATALLHPSDFYIGVHPEAWLSPAGAPIGFTIQTVDWQRNPAGNRALEAQFQRVTWVEETSTGPFSLPILVPEKTPVGSASPVTDATGQARVVFTPPDAGTYILEIKGGEALTEILLWVSGPGTPAWPDLPNQSQPLAGGAGGAKGKARCRGGVERQPELRGASGEGGPDLPGLSADRRGECD